MATEGQKVERCPTCGRLGNVGGSKYCYGRGLEKHEKARWEFVPVVPCDDAAVERAAKALMAENYIESPRRAAIVDEHWKGTGADIRRIYRMRAEAVLRAAGGQDVS